MGVAHVRGMRAQEPGWGRAITSHGVSCAVTVRAASGRGRVCVLCEGGSVVGVAGDAELASRLAGDARTGSC